MHKTLQLKILSSPTQLLHPVLEAGTILYEVGNRAATQGLIEHLQQDFIKEGEEQIFHLQGYELRLYGVTPPLPGPRYSLLRHSEDC